MAKKKHRHQQCEKCHKVAVFDGRCRDHQGRKGREVAQRLVRVWCDQLNIQDQYGGELKNRKEINDSISSQQEVAEDQRS